MKKAYTVIALLVLLGSMAVAANAQNSGRAQLKANIPFQFNVGEISFPAGEYTIAQVNPASDRVILRIRANDGGRSALVQMSPLIGKTAESSTLVFHRYGNKYFFAQAWIDADGEGLNASESRTERATHKENAALKTQTETVALRSR